MHQRQELAVDPMAHGKEGRSVGCVGREQDPLAAVYFEVDGECCRYERAHDVRVDDVAEFSWKGEQVAIHGHRRVFG